MGFFEGLMKGLGIVNMYNEDDEEDALMAQAMGKDTQYRKRGLENAKKVNGMYQCVRCKKYFAEGDIQIDHIIPQSRGGDSTRYNLQCMCKHCNCSKKADMSDSQQDLRRRKAELREQDRVDAEIVDMASSITKRRKE